MWLCDCCCSSGSCKGCVIHVAEDGQHHRRVWAQMQRQIHTHVTKCRWVCLIPVCATLAPQASGRIFGKPCGKGLSKCEAVGYCYTWSWCLGGQLWPCYWWCYCGWCRGVLLWLDWDVKKSVWAKRNALILGIYEIADNGFHNLESNGIVLSNDYDKPEGDVHQIRLLDNLLSYGYCSLMFGTDS